MKQKFTRIWTTLAITLIIASLCAASSTFAGQLMAQDQAIEFIENVLPVDLSKYQSSLVKQSSLGMPDGRVVDTLRYTLTSEDSAFDVSFNIENGVIRFCQLTERNGSIANDRQYANLREAVQNFLERYQTYSKMDSSNLVNMLNEVDLSKDTTAMVGSVRLTISSTSWAGMELTQIKWTNVINGSDYTSLQVRFQKDGTLESFRDTRAIYTIGDTSVNISKEQAIEIALKNLSTYSYEMPDHSFVSDFNVTEDKIVATLATSTQNSVLRPYWDIRMPLNQTYPGSVQGITVFIWANTGEIIEYSNIAFGGIDYNDNADATATPSPEPETQAPLSTATPEDNLLPNMVLAVGIATAIIAIAVTSVLLIKKRK